MTRIESVSWKRWVIEKVSVEFFANGVSFSVVSVTGPDFDATWDNPPVGSYTLTAVAKDVHDFTNRYAISAPVHVTIKAASGPNLTEDTFTVFSNGPATNLNVLANDSTSNGSLRIVGASTLFNPFTTARHGSVRIGYGASSLVYQAYPNTFGTDVLDYAVADTSGTNSSFAAIWIRALPTIQITSPLDDLRTNAPASLTISGSSFDYDAQ
jgi:hypothetical protein